MSDTDKNFFNLSLTEDYHVQPMSVDEYLKKIIMAEHQAIETACEEAIQGGLYGVRIDRNCLGEIRSIKIDPAVPYGELHEHIID